MKKATNLDTIFSQIIQSTPLDSALARSAYRLLADNIPDEVIQSGIISFARSYTVDDKLTLEIAFLTKDSFFYDLTGNSSKLSLSSMAFTKEMQVKLEAFYSDSAPSENEILPFRVELNISDGLLGYSYQAEGDRRLIAALMNFASQCLKYFHKAVNINE